VIRQRPSAIEKSRASRCCDRRGWNRRRYARTTSRHGGRAWAFSRCLGPLTFFPASRSAYGHTKGRRVGARARQRLYRFTDGLPFHSQWLNSTPTGPVSRASSRHVVRIGVPLKGTGTGLHAVPRPTRGEPETKGVTHLRKTTRTRGQEADDGVRASSGAASKVFYPGLSSHRLTYNAPTAQTE
jgi:hypothetical protein